MTWGGGPAPLQLAVPPVPSEISDSLLEDLIATHLVLPNRVTVPVKKGLDVTNLLFPLPCVSTCSGHRALGPPTPQSEGQIGRRREGILKTVIIDCL